MKNMSDSITALLICFLAGPLVSISAINTILEQASVNVYVPHNVYTYLSAFGLMFVFRGGK